MQHSIINNNKKSLCWPLGPRTYSSYNWKFVSFDQNLLLPLPPAPSNHHSTL